MSKLARDLGEKLGINLGNKTGNQLKGSVPFPVLKTGELDQEWEVGLPWYLKRLHGEKIVDTGFVSHQNFTKLLARLGYTVYGVDIDWFTYYPGISYLHSLVWEIPLKDKSVDTVIANSLLEHMGLPYYNQPGNPLAESETMQEFCRILKPDGNLLMQVPYAKNNAIIKHKGQQFYRTYTADTLRKLLGYFPGYYTQCPTFYARGKGCWIEVSEDVANHIEQGGGFPVCLCYMEAVKR